MKREAVGRRRLTTAREVIFTRGREREYRMTRGGQRGAILPRFLFGKELDVGGTSEGGGKGRCK
jgi:hypothetical protein